MVTQVQDQKTIANTMRAAVQSEFGDFSAIRIEERATPSPAAGEVLVRVNRAALNPVDFKTSRGGGVAGMLDAATIAAGFPLGWDLAGEVVTVGEGVTEFEIGDRVFGMIRFPQAAGTLAEYATAPVTDLARIPDGVSDDDAAAATLAALTAWQALVTIADVQPGQRVLIHAGAGGVGHYGIQIARARGAYVIATASTGKIDLVKGFGANEVIDYTQTSFEDVAKDIDAILNPMGEDITNRGWQVLKPGGIQVTLIHNPKAPQGLRGKHHLVYPSAADQQAIADLMTQGALRSHIAGTVGLDELPNALAAIEAGGTVGKYVVAIR